MSASRMLDPRSDDEIQQLAFDIVGDRVYLLDLVFEADPTSALMVFLPVTTGGLSGFTKDQLAMLGVIAVHGRHATAGRSINGWPIFLECEFWLRSDLVRAGVVARAMVEAAKTVPPAQDA